MIKQYFFFLMISFGQFSTLLSTENPPSKVTDFGSCLPIEKDYSTQFNPEAWNQRVYLATYPRSGNHWMRYLIEEATHIVTSSVYRDQDPLHLADPFPWGGYCLEGGYEGNCRYPQPNEPIVMKTHFPSFPPNSFDQQPSILAIRIIRNPIDSIYSFYRYAHENEDEVKLSPLLKDYMYSWRNFQEYWDQDLNTLTIRYEDLMEDPAVCLKKALKAIGYTFTEEDVQRAVQRFPPKGDVLKHLHHFTKEDLIFIQQELQDLLDKHGYDIPIPN